MGKAKRNRALRRKRVNPDDLAPKIAEGLTQGATAEEAAREFPTQPGATEAVDVMQAPPTVNRVPRFQAVLKDSLDSVWVDEPTGRTQRDAVVIVNPEVREALMTGWMCLRCYEPQDEAFPPWERQSHLPGCEYDIAARQAIDARMEFRGSEHVGPALPISQYMAEQEERKERMAAQGRRRW